MPTNLPIGPGLLVPLVSGLVLLVLLFAVVKVPLSYNVRNLSVRWITTILTALAFTLVVAILTVMLAFVNGMAKMTEGSGHPENVLVLSDGATDESFSNLAKTDVSDVERQPGVLADEQGQALASQEVYIIAAQPEHRRFVQVRGIDDPRIAGRVHGLELFPGGSWFSEAGVEQLPGKGDAKETAIQAVVGEGVARELGPDNNKERLDVGDIFQLGPRKWKVVGVMHSFGSTFGSEVWAKRSYVAELYGKETISSMVLKTANAKTATALAKDLKMNFRKANLSAQPESEYYAKLSGTSKQFLYAAIFVTIFMAIGGVFGVMNTMFAAISQRMKDIAVLRILGFARRQILVSFFLESLVIALVGGALGCFLGWFLANGYTATSIVSSGTGGFGKTVVFRVTFDANTIAAGMVLTLLMGVLGGLLPALSAMRLRPLESLR